MKIIDLRSDTVTNPTEAMREAMFNAVVGDDVYEDDPTVKELETLAASLVNKESALFVPSGTFGNQLSIFTHCKRGDEVIVGEDCHIVAHEVGAAAVIAGVQLRTLQTKNGEMNLEKVKGCIREEDIHFPETSLICIENAYSNGAVVSIDYMKDIYKIAKDKDVKVHLDGARLFNAATYLKVTASEITSNCDSVMFCLSKGLCAPIGSILAGDKEFIKIARKKRKLMGGGMRQSGFLAAAGIVALKDMVLRLNEDHENAIYFAKRLEEIPGIKVDFENLNINLIFFNIKKSNIDGAVIMNKFLEKGIKVNPPEAGIMRFATHYWVSREDINYVIDIIKGMIG